MKKILSKQNAEYWIKHLRLRPHPEGGYYRETYRSSEIIAKADLPKRYKGKRAFATAIYFLLRGNQFSAFHRLKSDEIWHFYKGYPLIVHMITINKKMSTVKLGPDTGKREQPLIVIKAGTWFAAALAKQSIKSIIEKKDPYALIGCTVAPGFNFADLEIGSREILCRKFPRRRSLIMKLTKAAHN